MYQYVITVILDDGTEKVYNIVADSIEFHDISSTIRFWENKAGGGTTLAGAFAYPREREYPIVIKKA